MDKIKVPSGSVQKFETVFDDLQSYIAGNINKRFSKIFNTYFGTLNDTAYGATTGTGLVVSLNSSTTLAITAGYAMLQTGDVIVVGSNIASSNIFTAAGVSSLALNTYYLVTLKYNSVGSNPISVMNGFLYNPSGESTPGSTKYTTYTDSYTVTLTSIGSSDATFTYGTNEVPLAIVKSSSDGHSLLTNYNTTGVKDVRTNLKLKKDILDSSVVVLKDRNSIGTEKINGTLEVTSFLSPEYKIGTTTPYGLMKFESGKFKITTNAQTTILDIDPATSSVNVTGTLKVNGKTVSTVEEYGATILNPRITERGDGKLTSPDPGMNGKLSMPAAGQGSNGKLGYTIKWGYDDILGTWNNTTKIFTMVTSISTSLVGYFIWFPTKSTNLKITVHSGTAITLTNVDGSAWDMAGFTIVNPNYAWVHSNCDSYVVNAIPLVNDSPQYSKITQYITLFGESPVRQEKFVLVEAGAKYTFTVDGYKGSSKVTTATGLTEVVAHATLTGEVAEIGATPTTNGFKVTITPNRWVDCEAYEICYTTENSGADFAATTHEKFITTNTAVDVTTSFSANYNVKVRPLISGQQVDTPLSTYVVSGAAGNLPQDQILVSEYFDFSAYSGTLAFVSSGTGARANVHTVTLTVVKNYQDSVTTLTTLPNSIIGDLLKAYNGIEYRISQILSSVAGSHTVVVVNSNGTGTTAPTNGAFTIGISAASRIVYKSNKLTIDYEISRIDVDCDVWRNSVDSTSLLVRVYQQGKSTTADSITVNATDTQFTADGDHQILGTYGDRNLIIDFFDPSDLSNANHLNEAGFAGRVTVFGRPLSERRGNTQV